MESHKRTHIFRIERGLENQSEVDRILMIDPDPVGSDVDVGGTWEVAKTL